MLPTTPPTMTTLMEVREVIEARFAIIDIMSSSWFITAWDWFELAATALEGGACTMAPFPGVVAEGCVSCKKTNETVKTVFSVTNNRF